EAARKKWGRGTTGRPIHAQQRKAASASRATVIVSARVAPEASEKLTTGAFVPWGHLSTGKASASVRANAQPIPTNAHRQSNALMRELAKSGSKPCPAAPPAVTTPITSPRRSGTHSPLVDRSGEYSVENPQPP